MTLRALILVSVSFLTLTLAACGLSPVYGSFSGDALDAAVAAKLDRVYVASIPDRSGQKLRNHLIDALVQRGGNTKAGADYKLAVGEVSESIYSIGIAKDATTTRSQIRLSSVFTLDGPDGAPLLQRTVTAVSSFNTLASQYTTLVTEEDARDQAITQLSEQIVMQLELYFSNPDAFKKPE